NAEVDFMSRVWQSLFLLASSFPGVFSGPLSAEEVDKNLPLATSARVDFYRDIEPIFKEKCESCHGPAQQLSGLRLDDRKAALAGGNSGVVIKPGNSADSRLIQLVAGLSEKLRMPLNGEPLRTEQIALLRGWIDQGVPWPERSGSTAPSSEAKAS